MSKCVVRSRYTCICFFTSKPGIFALSIYLYLLLADSLYNLVTLNLNHNVLCSLPADIHLLTHLQILSLSGNHLTLLPAGLGSLSHLTELHLDNNKLVQLPNEIGLLSRLKKLMLQKNDIASLPLVRMLKKYLAKKCAMANTVSRQNYNSKSRPATCQNMLMY